MTRKLRVATVSLAGCFGCHMSLLDIDEKLVPLLDLIELDMSPLTDIKVLGACDLGIIEGAVCNAENVHTLQAFRAHCKIIVAIGACAITGGPPAQRNFIDVRDVLASVYLSGRGVERGFIPNDPELPLPLAQVHPIRDVVKVDYSLPGCPPSAAAIWQVLTDLIAGRTPHLGHGLLRYD